MVSFSFSFIKEKELIHCGKKLSVLGPIIINFEWFLYSLRVFLTQEAQPSDWRSHWEIQLSELKLRSSMKERRNDSWASRMRQKNACQESWSKRFRILSRKVVFCSRKSNNRRWYNCKHRDLLCETFGFFQAIPHVNLSQSILVLISSSRSSVYSPSSRKQDLCGWMLMSTML